LYPNKETDDTKVCLDACGPGPNQRVVVAIACDPASSSLHTGCAPGAEDASMLEEREAAIIHQHMRAEGKVTLNGIGHQVGPRAAAPVARLSCSVLTWC